MGGRRPLVMLCYVMLCYVMLCYVMLCYVMLCYVMLCHVTYISNVCVFFETHDYINNGSLASKKDLIILT